jgi:membrane protease YdiL (CAAX protease family)
MKNKIKTIGIILLSLLGMLLLFIGVVGLGNVLQNNGQKLIGSLFMLLFPILIFIGVKIFNKKVNKLSLADYGFGIKKFVENFSIGIVIALTILALSFVVATNFFGLSFEFVSLKPNFANSLLEVTLSLLIIGGWEEFYFRGLVYITLIKNKFGFHLSAFISSIVFSIVHWVSFDMNETSYFWYIGIVFTGYILVYIYTITKSIWSAFSFHFIWNFIATLLDDKENKIGLFVMSNYTENSKQIDNIIVVVLGIFLLTLILIVEKSDLKNKIKTFEIE